MLLEKPTVSDDLKFNLLLRLISMGALTHNDASRTPRTKAAYLQGMSEANRSNATPPTSRKNRNAKRAQMGAQLRWGEHRRATDFATVRNFRKNFLCPLEMEGGAEDGLSPAPTPTLPSRESMLRILPPLPGLNPRSQNPPPLSIHHYV